MAWAAALDKAAAQAIAVARAFAEKPGISKFLVGVGFHGRSILRLAVAPTCYVSIAFRKAGT
jgi:hypothetical protein